MNTQHPNDPKGAVGATKCPLHLLPPYALRETAWVHKAGAEEYGPYNWRDTKVNATTYISALGRHLLAWQEGQDLDPKSGLTHLAHIAANANILMDAQKHGSLIDDRAKSQGVDDHGTHQEMHLEAVGKLLNLLIPHDGSPSCPTDIENIVENNIGTGPALYFDWTKVTWWRLVDEP